MHEKKNPNRPLIVYYIIALVVVMLLNALLFPQIERYSVKQVDYSEFLSMLEDGKVKSVEINDTQIAFTPVEQIQDGKATYYTTNRVTADDKLVERLLAAGVEFGQVVPEEMSPIISFLVTWVLRLVHVPQDEPAHGRKHHELRQIQRQDLRRGADRQDV